MALYSAPRRLVRILAAILLAASLGPRPPVAQAARSYDNPVVNRDFPDPMVLRRGPHDYYAYGTTTGWEIPGHHFPILH